MTRRERLKRCYFNEEVDRPAVYSRTGFPPGDPGYDRLKAYLRAHTELKQGWSSTSLERPYPTEVVIEPCSALLERRTTILHTPAKAKQRARGRLCLEGNIQINRMYEATPEDIRQETEQLIQDVFDDGRGLIVCPTASPYIPDQGEVCFPQYRAMIDAVLEYG